MIAEDETWTRKIHDRIEVWTEKLDKSNNMKENKTEETDENKESIVALNDSLDLQVYSNELKEQSEDETGEQMRWVKITKVDNKKATE